MARVWKFGADVDTDQIVPGRYAPYMRPDADVGEAAFIEARPDFNKLAQPGDIIVATCEFRLRLLARIRGRGAAPPPGGRDHRAELCAHLLPQCAQPGHPAV